LDKIMNLYQQTKLPVHYGTLANKIGVGKWTAYDMVKELEKLHYLKRDCSFTGKGWKERQTT